MIHWEGALSELEQNRALVHGARRVSNRRELFVKLPRSRTTSHILVDLRIDPTMRIGDWAATSLMADGPLREELLKDRFGLRTKPKTRGDIWIRFIGLSPHPIPKRDFHTRYPDVPFALAYTFVLAHELGHAMKGWRESAADRYAFRRLLLPQDPKAKKARDTIYGKIKHPGSFMDWPNR